MSRTDQQRTISTSDGAMDSSPLLNSTEEPSAGTAPSASRVSSRRGRLSRIFQIIIGGGTRRVMREPSVLVREAAAEQLEERQTDWSYSRPIVVLDFLWNVAFITVTVVVLILSRAEKPINPLRLWIGVYAAQCCIHMVCVWVEYCQRRQRYRRQRGTGSSLRETSISTSDGSHSDQGLDQIFEQISSSDLSAFKRLESANTSFSFIWWVVGFYWISTGNQSQNAPLLFWVCVAFLAFDVFFVLFCVSLACIVGVAVCCCLPCILGLMHAVAEQEGASEEELNMLPKYIFRQTGSSTRSGMDMAGPSGGVMSLISTRLSGAAAEQTLSAEDAECCICLSTYENNVELRELPCGHHFHSACVDRWLRMNPTCPLCKFNVSKDENISRVEHV